MSKFGLYLYGIVLIVLGVLPLLQVNIFEFYEVILVAQGLAGVLLILELNKKGQIPMLAFLVTGLFLVFVSVLPLAQWSFSGAGTVSNIWSMIAGVLLLVTALATKVTNKIGLILLGIWFVANGAIPQFQISFNNMAYVIGIYMGVTGLVQFTNK
ncbi:MAG: hypothetical protein JXA68_07085 [Ignavibacteriales bacterium]|nr:hypothetical protein [Ignavibacteriales bacterium]